MGWSRGSSLFEEVATVIRSHVTDYADRIDIYKQLIPIFEDNDAELYDVYGSVDEAFDEAWDDLYPNSIDEEYEEE
jgi:hypothetical protein